MAEKRTTAEAAIGRLRDGMTIGIGGWGSRRKPMALVRAILRSPLRDLTVVSYARPDLGLLAAAHRLPFLPIRAGLRSDVMRVNPHLRTVRSPYADGEELVAMPALRLDAALVHLNRADAAGNGQYLGPDPYFDDLFCLAAERAYMSCEKVVPTERLLAPAVDGR